MQNLEALAAKVGEDSESEEPWIQLLMQFRKSEAYLEAFARSNGAIADLTELVNYPGVFIDGEPMIRLEADRESSISRCEVMRKK